ncbi:MAG: AAA family ATPase [Kiritimatiellae bacterium]|nr:AAA family ATPase [Kiritimatiellia bacterium]
MAKMLVQLPDGKQFEFALKPGEKYVIGRASDSSIRIPVDAVSSHHAALEFADGSWWLEDLDSSNGTLVDDSPVTKTALRPGADIVFGAEVAASFFDDEPAGAASKRGDGATEEDVRLVKEMSVRSNRIRKEIAKVIVGQVDIIDQVMMVIIAGGHGLLVGMPGMAKTTLCATIAKVLDMEFKRVQFTPDLMPTDITGTEILEHDPVTDKKSFRFIKGPIFTNMLLADEINRTPPKTQASLLEAMQEKCVTVGNQTYKLDAPFFVLATQNPIEQEGTYPLPEAQQDRFMFNLWVDYPKEDEEETVVKATTMSRHESPQKVITKEELLQLQAVVRKIPVSDHVIKYAVRLVRATRPQDEKSPDFIKKYVQNGAGPRAGQFLVLAAKARAVLEGRIHVSCADVVKAATPVLRHRIQANFAADSEGISTTDLVKRLLKTIEQPDDRDY